VLVQTYFRGNDFATIKIFDQKNLGSIPTAGKLFCNNKNFRPKHLEANFWFEPIPEEMNLTQ